MFIEFHLYDGGEKILFNINNINVVHQLPGKTLIYVGEVDYRIKENYADVIDAINNYYNLSNA